MSTNAEFLPQGYEPPKSGGRYYKFQQGENRFRILSSPIIGWLDWDDNKPLRYRMNNKPAYAISPDRSIKHFWAFVVWNYEVKELQILEITQSSIQQHITAITRDPDWGVPFEYDFSVFKTGQKLETEYTVSPKPHKKISDDMQAALIATPINLDALFDGADPFSPI